MRDNGRVTNLCFHGIGTAGREMEDGEAAYWVPAEFFDDVLDLVAGRDDVRLSFDDGNASDVDLALPALLARGLVADFFPLAARLGKPGSVDPEGLRALTSHGMSVGSHGMRHTSWRDARDCDLRSELDTARVILAEAAGHEVTKAACPLGLYDRRVLGELRRRGYTTVMTSDRAHARSEAWLQPRFSLTARDDLDSVSAILDRPDGGLATVRSEARILLKSLR